MAHLIPNQVMPGRSLAFARVFRLCKALPDRYTIWQGVYQTPNDLLVIFDECQIVRLHISGITPEDIRSYLQRELFGQETHPLALKRQALLDTCVDTILLFPLLEKAGIHQLELEDHSCIGGEVIHPDRFADALQPHLSDRLTDGEIALARSTFCPEVVIPESLTVRPLIDRNIQAGLTQLLLDIDQETVLKTDLHLEPDNQALVRNAHVRLVTGVAGSGKSLLVLYRLRLMRTLMGDHKRMIVLTHNRALIRDLEARYLVLSNGDRRVEFKTFLAWCHDNWPNGFPWASPISNHERLRIARTCVETHLADTDIKAARLLEEIDWCKDSFTTKNAYLEADRSGRGFRLSDKMRQRVYDAIVQYQQTLDQRELLDWGDVPRKLWQAVEAGQASLPRYDAIFVDEAQFFAPYWFTILKTCLNPATGHLFIVADPTQGFLKRRQSWLALGIDVRGRSQKLVRSYRTTQSIMTFANLLYRDRSPNDADAILAPDLAGMPAGIMPTVLPLSSPQDEISRVTNEVAALLEHGTKPEQILIIHAESSGVKPMIVRLNKELGKGMAEDPRSTRNRAVVRVCSLDASTGLESPIVFLLGIHKLYEKEQSVYLTEEERAELIRTNTRKLYMAITRTGQRLVITYVGILPRVLEGMV